VISGSTATIQFTTPAVTGTLTPTGGAFQSGGKQFTFTITGVTYTGGAVTTVGPPTNRISQVIVTAASNGVNVVASLNQAASNYQFSVKGNQVSVTFS